MTTILYRLEQLEREAIPGPFYVEQREDYPNGHRRSIDNIKTRGKQLTLYPTLDAVVIDRESFYGHVAKADLDLFAEARNHLPALLRLARAVQVFDSRENGLIDASYGDVYAALAPLLKETTP